MQGKHGRLLSTQARNVFVVLLEDAVFGISEFDNRTFRKSPFNRSSVSHVNHVTVKSNSMSKEN